MDYKEAYEVLVNHIHIDVGCTTNFERDYECLMKCAEALEKQIPRKPKRIARHAVINAKECPVCGQEFGFNTGMHYCECCGQKLDWSDEDETNDDEQRST